MEFKKLSAVESVGAVSDTANVLIEENGVIKRTLKDNISGGIKLTSTAEVGQTIVVKAIDDNGKPIEWECDQPDILITEVGHHMPGSEDNNVTVTYKNSYADVVDKIHRGLRVKAVYELHNGADGNMYAYSQANCNIYDLDNLLLNTPFVFEEEGYIFGCLTINVFADGAVNIDFSIMG
jgi:hypothetical protein